MARIRSLPPRVCEAAQKINLVALVSLSKLSKNISDIVLDNHPITNELLKTTGIITTLAPSNAIGTVIIYLAHKKI